MQHRLQEQEHLFNPVLSSLLLYNAAKGYKQESSEGLPFVVSFLVLPIVMTKAIREDLSITVSTKLRSWLSKYDYHLLGFSARARAFGPYTRMGLMFGIQAQLLQLSGSVVLPSAARLRRRKAPELPTETVEVVELKKKALYLGRWFSRAGSPTAVLSAWGVRP